MRGRPKDRERDSSMTKAGKGLTATQQESCSSGDLWLNQVSELAYHVGLFIVAWVNHFEVALTMRHRTRNTLKIVVDTHRPTHPLLETTQASVTPFMPGHPDSGIPRTVAGLLNVFQLESPGTSKALGTCA
jgi:hypothetical protein